jgi:hypothetical protein
MCSVLEYKTFEGGVFFFFQEKNVSLIAVFKICLGVDSSLAYWQYIKEVHYTRFPEPFFFYLEAIFLFSNFRVAKLFL